MREVLYYNLSEKDSFNLIFSNINISRISETWLPADSATVMNTFASLNQDELANYSNLPTLMSNGIDFIKNRGDYGNILLIANSDQVGNSETANDLIKDLTDMMNETIPIHVVDFQDRNFNYYYIAGRQYYGNEYFYTNITRVTAGAYFRTLYSENSLSSIISSAITSLTGYISSFDLILNFLLDFAMEDILLVLVEPQ